MSCKRIAGLFAILLLRAVAFETVYTRSRTESSTRNVFQLMRPIKQSACQFSHDFKGRTSNGSQGRHALSFSPSQKVTNAAIIANGKSYRSVLEGSVDYKLIHIKAGKPAITKRINGSKIYSALASSIVSDASGRDAAKRLIQYLSNNLTKNLILTAMKGVI